LKNVYTNYFWPADEGDPQFWVSEAEAELKEALRLQARNKNVAKNVILFLGDGMGVQSVTSARILKGQKNGRGPDYSLNMDAFPHSGISKVRLAFLRFDESYSRTK